MSKWRPSPLNCLYVIPDIHGNINLLNKILKRILPLRKSDGGKDHLIFLGDYIDRHYHSHLVLDKLIELKQKYTDQVIFLSGNHEDLFLKSLNAIPNKTIPSHVALANYRCWLNNGGLSTLGGYLERNGQEIKNILSLELFQIKNLIPKEHLEFLQQELQYYWEHENYVFVHGGCDPEGDLFTQDPDVLMWDRSLLQNVVKAINEKQDLTWEKIIVTGHNVRPNRQPIIHPKFLMLDCGSPKQLLIAELRSMTGFMADPNKDRLVEITLNLTLPQSIKPKTFRRVE